MAVSEKSTCFTYLMYKDSSGKAKKVADITSYPDFLAPAERLDVSDLSHKSHLYAEGMDSDVDMTFGFNYTSSSWDAVKALEGNEHDMQIWFGDNGAHGCWGFSGTIHASLNGGDVGGVRTCTITVYLSSDIDEASPLSK